MSRIHPSTCDVGGRLRPQVCEPKPVTGGGIIGGGGGSSTKGGLGNTGGSFVGAGAVPALQRLRPVGEVCSDCCFYGASISAPTAIQCGGTSSELEIIKVICPSLVIGALTRFYHWGSYEGPPGFVADGNIATRRAQAELRRDTTTIAAIYNNPNERLNVAEGAAACRQTTTDDFQNNDTGASMQSFFLNAGTYNINFRYARNATDHPLADSGAAAENLVYCLSEPSLLALNGFRPQVLTDTAIFREPTILCGGRGRGLTVEQPRFYGRPLGHFSSALGKQLRLRIAGYVPKFDFRTTPNTHAAVYLRQIQDGTGATTDTVLMTMTSRNQISQCSGVNAFDLTQTISGAYDSFSLFLKAQIGDERAGTNAFGSIPANSGYSIQVIEAEVLP